MIELLFHTVAIVHKIIEDLYNIYIMRDDVWIIGSLIEGI